MHIWNQTTRNGMIWGLIGLSCVPHLPSLVLKSQLRHSQAYPFGWEPDQNGFRGHVFATPDNSTVVLSIKGTSAGVFGGGGPTSEKDKRNDNLLFSCCCAKVGWSWTPVCGCWQGGYKCDQDCLEQSLTDDSLFYTIGTVSVQRSTPTVLLTIIYRTSTTT